MIKRLTAIKDKRRERLPAAVIMIVLFLIPALFSQESVSAQRTGIIINEIFYDPEGLDTGLEWVEIINTSDIIIDITGYDLSFGEGGYYTFPSFSIGPGVLATVHNNLSGEDTATDLYSPGTLNMPNIADSIALFDSTEHNEDTIVDFVQYGSGGNAFETTADAAGIWTAGEYIEDVAEGHSTGLCPDGEDNDATTDWHDFTNETEGEFNDCIMSPSPTIIPSASPGTPGVTETPTPTLTFPPTGIPSETPPSGTPTVEPPTEPPTYTIIPTETLIPTITASPTLTPSNTPFLIPTFTPTPTPTLTSTPTLTPSVTMTITATAYYSPTTTLTPVPTITLTPAPPNYGPDILAAGYLRSYLDESNGGTMNLTAIIQDAEGDPITEIALYYGGKPAGVTEQIDDDDGFHVWNMTPLVIDSALPTGEYLFELAAFDDRGEQGNFWPYLHSGRQDIGVHTPPWYAGAFSEPGSDDGPDIQLAGYWDTIIDEQGGEMTIIAYVTDPQGQQDVEKVEIYAGGTATGLLLKDDGASGDFNPGDGIFGYRIPLAPGELPEGYYLLELRASDREQNKSELWPYLIIHDATETTPTRTPTPTNTPKENPNTPPPDATATPTPESDCLSAGPLSHDFGLVWRGDIGPEESVTIINNNCSFAVQIELSSDNPDNFRITDPAACESGCTITINPNDSKEIKMRFTPQSCGGINGNLVITRTNGNESITVSLTGTGRCV